MADSPRWFDRKFNFDFETNIFPKLVTRLKQFPQQLRTVFAEFPPHKLKEKPGGKWSALEQLGHLIVLESLWQSRINEFLNAGGENGELSPADLDNRATDEGNFNSQTLPELLDCFEASRAETIRMLAATDARHNNQLLHPRLNKPMRLVDHLFFMAEHDEHHRKSIESLRH
jgi:uncharacterized damage-inducible protein DinB